MAQKGFRQVDLAAKLSVTQAAVSKWLTGATEPKAQQLIALAEALEISPVTLVTGRTGLDLLSKHPERPAATSVAEQRALALARRIALLNDEQRAVVEALLKVYGK